MAIDNREEISNYLLNKCYLIGTEDSMKDKYYYVLNHEDEFRAVFSPIGYVMNINRSLKVIQVVNSHGLGRLSLMKYESIILLIVRVLYMEKRESLSTNADKVYVTVSDVLREYDKINLPRSMDQKFLEISLKRLKEYNLVSFTGKLDNENSQIQIYSSVMLAIPDNLICLQYDNIRDLITQYEGTEEIEE